MNRSPDDDVTLGERLHDLIEELYPICRSITGDGVRETLAVLGRSLPLEVHDVPSGTEVLDWTVPDEWNVRDAYVADSEGRRVIDFRRSNLHVVNYSTPVRTSMTLEELRPHLHTLPEQPELVPYRTTYYERSWGFCLSQHDLDELRPGTYEVVIDATLEPGSLTYGEVVIEGSSDELVLVSAHCCHPSLCDDNLSGLVVARELAERMSSGPRPRRTHCFLFAPGTIGAITWLARNRERASRIVAGLTLTCLGDDRSFTYKRTLDGSTPIDRAAAHVLSHRDDGSGLIDFFPYGYDERQFNSPGFRAPVGSLMRGRHGQFAEYHTSGDNLDFVRPEQLQDALDTLTRILGVVDRDRVLVNNEPFGEPQLGRRGLYRAVGGVGLDDIELALLWVLNLSDGDHSLLDISDRAAIPFETIDAAAGVLEEAGLLSGFG